MKKNIINILLVALFSLGVFFLNNELEKILINWGINLPMLYYLHWFITLPVCLLLIVLITDEDEHLKKKLFWFYVVIFIIIFIIINSFFAWKINTGFRQWFLLTLIYIVIISLFNWLIFKILNFTQKIFQQKKKTVKLLDKIISCLYQVFYSDICAYNFQHPKQAITIDKFKEIPLLTLQDFSDGNTTSEIVSKLNKIFFPKQMPQEIAASLSEKSHLMFMFCDSKFKYSVKDLAQSIAISFLNQAVIMATKKRGFQIKTLLNILKSWAISFKPVEIKKILKTGDPNSKNFERKLFKALN